MQLHKRHAFAGVGQQRDFLGLARQRASLHRHRCHQVITAAGPDAQDRIAVLHARKQSSTSRRHLAVRLQREAQAQAALGQRNHAGVGARSHARVQRQRRNDNLTVVKLKQLLHRLAIASRGRDVEDAAHIRRALAAKQHRQLAGRAAEYRRHLVAFADAGAADVLELTHALDPAVARKHDVAVFVGDKGRLVKRGLFG